MKLLFSLLVLLASIICQAQNATEGKSSDNQEEKVVLVKPDAGLPQAIARGQVSETAVSSDRATIDNEKADLTKSNDKKAKDKKAKPYRGDNRTKRIIIIAAIAIAAVAIIIYVVASASVTKN